MRVLLIVVALLLAAGPARADGPARPVVGFRVEGKSKLTEKTLARLSHVDAGDYVTPEMVPTIQQALMSSELFKTALVRLEDGTTADGKPAYVLVATLDDKLSWIAAPTLYVLPASWSFGVGYAENDLLGENKKMLLYGQIGNKSTLFFGTFFDPQVNGSPLQYRLDVYLLHKIVNEYVNPPDNARDFTIGRQSTYNFLDAGALVGWMFKWWLIGDMRLRGAYVYFTDAKDPTTGSGLLKPQNDGWDWSVQARLTLDARRHLYGVTWGPYLQLELEPSVPGLDSYGYQIALARAYYSWRFFGEHELELRSLFNIGRHLPFNEEFSNGGVSDLRGYDVDQFRGDLRAVGRAEYSLPIAKWKIFAFRAIAFWDTGYVGYKFQNLDGKRVYLPSQHNGAYWIRNDVGAGLRLYVKNVVLPLLGLDLGYGIEGHSPEVYFEVGLTDF